MTTKIAATSSLALNGLRLSVFLGVYPEERSKKQAVSLDAHIRFTEPLKACHSDRLEDTYCYDKTIAFLKEKIADRQFQLIEHLAHELYSLMKNHFSPEASVTVRLTKQPAIPDLVHGVTFEYGDQALAWSF